MVKIILSKEEICWLIEMLRTFDMMPLNWPPWITKITSSILRELVTKFLPRICFAHSGAQMKFTLKQHEAIALFQALNEYSEFFEPSDYFAQNIITQIKLIVHPLIIN